MASSAGFVFYTAYEFIMISIFCTKLYTENLKYIRKIYSRLYTCTQRVEAVFGLSNQRAAFGFNVRRKCFAHTTAIRLGSLLEENEAGKDVEVFTFLMVRVL